MYTTLSRSYFVSSGRLSHYWSLHDTPAKTGQDILRRYIQDAHAIFTNTTLSLLDFKKTFTKGDEKHLQTMLNLLTDARKTWEEESR